jgi:hypothetical protein
MHGRWLAELSDRLLRVVLARTASAIDAFRVGPVLTELSHSRLRRLQHITRKDPGDPSPSLRVQSGTRHLSICRSSAAGDSGRPSSSCMSERVSRSEP